MKWFVESKNRYLAYILFWKIADITGTFLMASKYGWEVEIGPMIQYLAPYLGHSAATAATIPVVLGFCYVAYDRTPVVAEIAMLLFTAFSIGNFTQLFLPYVGSALNIVSYPAVLLLYFSRGLKPLWFERSPTRDEILIYPEVFRRLKTRILGGDS